MAILAVNVGGYRGYAVHLSRSATMEERAQFKKRLLQSPVVWKVFENVVPSEVNLQ